MELIAASTVVWLEVRGVKGSGQPAFGPAVVWPDSLIAAALVVPSYLRIYCPAPQLLLSVHPQLAGIVAVVPPEA